VIAGTAHEAGQPEAWLLIPCSAVRGVLGHPAVDDGRELLGSDIISPERRVFVGTGLVQIGDARR
jgi:hypothetical protein